MDAVVYAVVMATEGVASWGQEKTRIVRHKLEDKFNVFKDNEFVEDVEPIDPKTIQVRKASLDERSQSTALNLDPGDHRKETDLCQRQG